MRIISSFGIALFAVSIADAGALTAHFAREDRIVAEVVPAIVVGDAVYLATPRRSRVLAIFTMPAVKPIAGAVIIQGLGLHADWALINGLRTDLADAPRALPFSAVAAWKKSRSLRTAWAR